MNPYEIAIICPACRDNAISKRDVYRCARPYLCAPHRAIFDAADLAAHQGVCPWSPAPCRTICAGGVA